MYSSTIISDTSLSIKYKKIDQEIVASIPHFRSSETPISEDILLFKQHIDVAYDEIIKWRKNVFTVPKGKTGRLFIEEITKWLEYFNEDSKYRCIALKVFMLLPALLLQKPSKKSKNGEHKSKLEERLKQWDDRDIDAAQDQNDPRADQRDDEGC